MWLPHRDTVLWSENFVIYLLRWIESNQSVVHYLRNIEICLMIGRTGINYTSGFMVGSNFGVTHRYLLIASMLSSKFLRKKPTIRSSSVLLHMRKCLYIHLKFSILTSRSTAVDWHSPSDLKLTSKIRSNFYTDMNDMLEIPVYFWQLECFLCRRDRKRMNKRTREARTARAFVYRKCQLHKVQTNNKYPVPYPHIQIKYSLCNESLAKDSFFFSTQPMMLIYLFSV